MRATVAAVDTDEATRTISESFDRLATSARRSVRAAAAELASGLQPAAWPVFREVVRAQRIQASTIVGILGMDKSAVSRHIKELRQHGLVEAERDEHDARVFWITPTPLALARLAVVIERQLGLLRAELDTWEPEDVERFALLLTRFSGAGRGD
jgi:DNA-binding MarR family transcriptional regulator